MFSSVAVSVDAVHHIPSGVLSGLRRVLPQCMGLCTERIFDTACPLTFWPSHIFLLYAASSINLLILECPNICIHSKKGMVISTLLRLQLNDTMSLPTLLRLTANV